MSNQRSYYQPKFLHEMQLGLVVHGGVSLAIYTHGVCQEFYNAVRGRGVYKLVKALTDADLVVDLISGSSAGGINGILLSYALTNSNARELVDFSAFVSIWRNSGDLLNLIRKPGLFGLQKADSSWNNFYQRVAVAALERGIEHKMPRPPQEWYSASKELDLAIAGTNYLGKLDRTLDETGINLGIKNHRTLFHLKHRQGRKQPFDPSFKDPELLTSPADTYQALAKLCQITAGTPMIFPLVEVDVRDRQNLVDRQLTIWGKLEQHYSPDPGLDRGNNKLYFLDGGLLDNAPFTCAIEATYYRLPYKPGQRKLFYIDPNPEHLTERVQLRGNKKARAGRILQATVLSVPIHQSITNDLRTIHEHNQKVRRYQTLIDRAEAAIDSQQLLASADRTQSQIYVRGRLFDFRDRNLPLLLHSDLASQNTNYSTIIEKIEVVLTNKLHTKQDRIHYHKLLARFESQVVDLDVEYSIRKHFYLIDRIADLPKRDLDSAAFQQLQNLSLQLSCNIKLLEVVRAGIQLLLRDRSVSNYFYYLINQEPNDRRLRALVYELIFRLHRFLLDERRFKKFVPSDPTASGLKTISDDFWQDLPKFAAATNGRDRWLSQAQISSVFAQIKHRITDLHQSHDLHRSIWMDRHLEYDNERNRSFPSILKQISAVAEAEIARAPDRYTAELLRQWHAFDTIDCELYPFEYLASLSDKKIITPICISPENAQLGIGQGKNVQEKLGGNKLYNIGGLFKKSWRSNDLLWGRLDGLNRVIEGIVTPRSVMAFANFVSREAAKTNSTQAQYLDWLITESLPHLSGVEREKIAGHLERLARPERQIDRTELKHILADIVLAGQREILTSDVHSIGESLDEQPGWWRFPTTRSTPDNSQSAKSATQISTVPTSNPNTIVRIVHQSLTNLAVQQQHFFRNQYRVSVDKLWENMPLVTLINVCTKLVLMLRNILVKVFGISASNSSIRHPLYHWLDGRLQSIYWWLQGGAISIGTIHRRPRIILLQLLGALATICGFILAFLLSPLWLLFSLPGAIVCWFLQTLRLKRLTGNKSAPFLPQSREQSKS